MTIVISGVVVALIMLQGKGAGLGSAWGGGGEHFQTRRGVEKYLFRFTGILVFVFLILSIINIIL